MFIQHFEDLAIWKESRTLSREIFLATENGSFSRDFRFREQMRCAVGSIMDNIAEGFGREGNKEFIQFLYIAKGSCAELRSQLYRAMDFSYLNKEQAENLLKQTEKLSKNISGFIAYLKKSDIKGQKYK
jgi:four helix bundle protein